VSATGGGFSETMAVFPKQCPFDEMTAVSTNFNCVIPMAITKCYTLIIFE
jgi:hypothetical protein